MSNCFVLTGRLDRSLVTVSPVSLTGHLSPSHRSAWPVTYYRRSLTTGGHLLPAVTYYRRSLTTGCHLLPAVTYYRRSLTTGGHLLPAAAVMVASAWPVGLTAHRRRRQRLMMPGTDKNLSSTRARYKTRWEKPALQVVHSAHTLLWDKTRATF